MRDKDAALPPSHWIICAARPTGFVLLSRSILGRMGYAIVSLDDWLEKPAFQAHAPELCLAEERLITELPDDREFNNVPIVALTGRDGVTSKDPRIIAGIQMPAGLHELYRVLQKAFETTPRSSIRVPARLPAKLTFGGVERQAEVRSLSENGCLVRMPESIPLGAQVEIRFQLPSLGEVETAAAPTYQVLPDTGLVFERTTPGHRRSIQIFVEHHYAS